MSDSLRNIRQPAESIWKLRGGVTLWELARKVVCDAQRNELFERAAGLAFEFLLALFSMLFIMLAVFDLFASRSVQLRTSLLAYFADLLPSLAFQLLKRTAEELATKKTGEKMVVGIVVGLWLVSEGVVSIVASLNMAFRVRESRSWIKVRAIALGLTLVISILILSALAIVLVSGDIVDWLGVRLQLATVMIMFWKALQVPTAMLFLILTYTLILTFGPDLKDKRRHWITPGSLFGAILWLAASEGFRIYLEYVNDYNLIFGSLGALVILLVWLYVTGLAFLIGGEIDANIARAGVRESVYERRAA